MRSRETAEALVSRATRHSRRGRRVLSSCPFAFFKFWICWVWRVSEIHSMHVDLYLRNCFPEWLLKHKRGYLGCYIRNGCAHEIKQDIVGLLDQLSRLGFFLGQGGRSLHSRGIVGEQRELFDHLDKGLNDNQKKSFFLLLFCSIILTLIIECVLN